MAPSVEDAPEPAGGTEIQLPIVLREEDVETVMSGSRCVSERDRFHALAGKRIDRLDLGRDRVITRETSQLGLSGSLGIVVSGRHSISRNL